MHVIGIDVGTTGTKVVLIDESGRAIGESTKRYETFQPVPTWFEQEPEDWWSAAREGIQEVLERFLGRERESVAAIGLTGQYHGLVTLDDAGGVVRRCILWNDQRTEKEYKEFVHAVGEEQLLQIVASIGGLYSTVCKLLWLREHEPANYEKVRHLLLPKDYVRYRLTGEFATDVSDASGTALLNVRERSWSGKLCDTLGIDSAILPAVHESHQTTGTVSASIAQQLGLPKSTKVVAGGGDQACAAVGNGIFDEGVVGLSLGTSGVLYAATNVPKADHAGRLDTFCHAVPGRWALLGVTNAAAASLAWLVNSFFPQKWASEADAYRELEKEARNIPPASDNLIFLPYLAGERHPHRDPNARGAFVGLSTRHTSAHAYRAVMEGVAFSFRDCLEVMRSLGVRDEVVRGTGGGLRSGLWSEIQTNIVGRRIDTRRGSDTGAAFGAAMLALVGAGAYEDVYQVNQVVGQFDSGSGASAEQAKRYEQAYLVYTELYKVLRGTFAKLTG